MVALLALLTFAAGWLATPPPARYLTLGLAGGAESRKWKSRKPDPRSRWLADSTGRAVLCLLAAATAGWAVHGPIGGLVGAAGGLCLSWWVGRLEPPEAARAREQMARDLPLAIDLLSACATAGRPAESALGVVSAAVGGPLAATFDGLRARLALGADPVAEWRSLGTQPQLAPLARTMTRALESGAPGAAGLSRLADDVRRERRTQAQLRARTVGVKAAGPLALCFLPAFVVIGVVPTVAGAFHHLLL